MKDLDGLNYKVTVRHKDDKVFSFWEDEDGVNLVKNSISVFGLIFCLGVEMALSVNWPPEIQYSPIYLVRFSDK